MISVWQPIFENAIPPIYRQDQSDQSLFYAPGWLVVVPIGVAPDFQAAIHDPERTDWPEAIELRGHAIKAQKTWGSAQTLDFFPLCLTLYVNNACNLNCAYCFSKAYRSQHAYLSLDAICAAAEIVAENCRTQQKPFTVAFHGGGEPTLAYDLVRQALEALKEIAARYRLDLFRYIATNGVLSQARASDLAKQFDLVGLSCDGPPQIQNRQRPLLKEGKHTSSWFVERTARAAHLAGKPLHVRVTITPETIARQTEIAEYICQTLRPQEIYVEPVYTVLGDGTKSRFHSSQAKAYVDAFVQARHIAQEYGIRWLASGSRPAEIHSAYCNVLRNVLNLTPEGVATSCFKISNANTLRQLSMDIGAWDVYSGHFRLNMEHIHHQRLRIWSKYEECARCFNQYHCARQCPDVCMLESEAQSGGFRCRVQSMLANLLIQEEADVLCSKGKIDRPVIGKMTEYL